MKQFAVPKIPSADLARIDIPVSLIWGRHDRANKLDIAIDAGEQFGWNLHVIEQARDDPKLEQPAAFVRALLTSSEEPEKKRISQILKSNPK